MGALSDTPRMPPEEAGEAAYRYGVVFAIVLAVVVVTILSGDGDASRALSFALVGLALMVAVTTAREPSAVRRRRRVVSITATVLITLGIAVGFVRRDATFALTALVTLAIPVTLGRGLLRLVRERGATLQAVAGALAIYLLIGLAFASAVGFVAAIESTPYFAQGTSGSVSDDVYYSFTVMTTTGLGDFTAAHHVGRALAVIEMLIGQLYLVTVIGILIGRRVGRDQ